MAGPGAPQSPGAASGLAAGIRADVRITVTEADTASALGSGDVPVLGTPRLLALAEEAAVAAVAPHLAPGYTTVGTTVSLEHRRASPPGAEVLVEAELTEVDGPRLAFRFLARAAGPGEDASPVIGSGSHERVIVDRSRFLARAAGPG
jgi:fluoroacetyl-CoA thioesterase